MARQSGDLPTEIIKAKDEDLQGSGKEFVLQDIVADATGRIKTSQIFGDYDDDGHRHAVRKIDHAWDGEMGILYSDNLKDDYLGGAIITAKKQKDFSLMRRPLRFFVGRFLEALEGASSAGKNIEIKRNKQDGTWQISFMADDPAFGTKNCIWKGTVDPSKNFSVTNGDILRRWHGGSMRYSANYKEINDGIWFPVNEKIECFYADGVNELITNAKITNIVINDPNLGKTAFHIDFPKGTRVTDRIGGIAYVLGDPSSVRKLAEPLGQGRREWPIPAREGTRLPVFDGIKIDLGADKAENKIMLICFFDMDQRPSRNCLLQLSTRAQELMAKDVVVAAIQASKIDDSLLNEWIEKNNISFPIGMIHGDEEKIRFIWGVRSLPWLILTDKQHVVRAEGFGLEQFDEKLQETSSNVIRPERLTTDQAGTRVVDEEYGAGADMPAPSTVCPVGQRALLFDGVDDCLHVPASPTLELKPPFTIEMWIKPDFSEIRQKMNAETLISGKKGIHWLGLMRKNKKTAEPERPLSGGFFMFVQPSSRPEHSCYGSLYLGTTKGTLFQEDMFVGERLETGQPRWLRVSASCRRSEKYVPVQDEQLVIGEPFFKGEIAEIRIWNKVFTRSDPCRYEDTALTGNEPNLVACWDFEHTEGQMVYDISPNGNHAYMGMSKEADEADPIWVSPYAIPYQSDQKTDVE